MVSISVSLFRFIVYSRLIYRASPLLDFKKARTFPIMSRFLNVLN